MTSILNILRSLLALSLSLTLFACATTPRTASILQQGQRYFESGYYKHAMQQLLPLAADGNAEAQYAIGYMYYYGYGVTQDTDSGYFWIKRATDKAYPPAIHALAIIDKEKTEKSRIKISTEKH